MYRTAIRSERFAFADLRELFAKANEEKSGDRLAGIAAGSELERTAAKLALADVRLCESVESGHSAHDRSAMISASLGIVKQPVRLDSQAKYAVVARGQADVYLRLPTESGSRAVGGETYVERIWDHAAGALIAQEAGCTVTDALGNPLDFSHGRGLEANRGIVCAAPDLHPRLIRAIAAARALPA